MLQSPDLVTKQESTPEQERPACAVCGGFTYRPLVVRNGHQLVRCARCRLVFVSPRPRRREAIDSLYTDRTYSTRQVSHALTPGRMREAEWRLDKLERHTRRRGRLLDVGCSAGSFLIAARQRGWNVCGIDVSPEAVAHARNAYALDVGVSTLEDAALPERSVDVVTLFECIEHMLDPRTALQSAARLLRDDGMLVITTPNVDGFVPRTTYWLLGRTLGAWEHPTPPHHLYQFSRRTLTALLHDVGFQVERCETRPMGLRYTVKEMESAVIEAVSVRLGRTPMRVEAGNRPSRATPSPGTHGRGVIGRVVRRAARTAVGAGCWALGVLLYTVPVRMLGAGDSMLVVARKRRGAEIEETEETEGTEGTDQTGRNGGTK
jgi:2-polyprenyl-3-methyl-5-hydroxy-6-metoxy-1,4-benzoquinol methylase